MARHNNRRPAFVTAVVKYVMDFVMWCTFIKLISCVHFSSKHAVVMDGEFSFGKLESSVRQYENVNLVELYIHS